MDKNQRKRKEFFKYKKRLSNWLNSITYYFDGDEITNPKLIDLLKDNIQYKLKHTTTLCSCYCCSGYYKYRRHEKKREDQKLIKEYFED